LRFLLLAAAYLILPGHPELLLSGVPLGQTGIAAGVALALLVPVLRNMALPAWGYVALLLLCAFKPMFAVAGIDEGWLARYYANAEFSPPVERSIDYRNLHGTRIDDALTFRDAEFPVHFFNDARFARGDRREVTEPFSVRWTGETFVAEPAAVALAVQARGRAALLVDGREVVRLDNGSEIATAAVSLQLEPGVHHLEARYSKARDSDGLFELRGSNEAGRLLLDSVTPWAAPGWRRVSATPVRLAAILVHITFVAVLISIAVPMLRRHRPRSLAGACEPLIVIALTAQGLWKSRHLVDHVWTLTGGDDWMTFEHNARDVVLNGILMTEGAPLGRGQPFFAYPGYTYFTAAVHAVTGESLAGVVLMNFVLLAVSTVLVLRLARELVPPPAALAAVAWLMLLQQADFVRYYTVTLLSENLYVMTSAGLVLGLTRYLKHGRTAQLAASGAWGGWSALTRPSAMLFLPFGAMLAAIPRWRARRSLGLVTAPLLFAAAWMLVVAPATIRNALVSGSPVLISSGQAKSFIDYNMPPENQRVYLEMFDGSLLSAAIVLARMLLDQPVPFLTAVAHKVGFALGMVHWASGVSPHPELLLTTALYTLAFIVVPASRTLAAWPLHAFVLTHLISVTLSIPWNYGYRMILPMYPLMCVFAMAVPTRWLTSFIDRRAPAASLPA
jgi:hypothetical protein